MFNTQYAILLSTDQTATTQCKVGTEKILHVRYPLTTYDADTFPACPYSFYFNVTEVYIRQETNTVQRWYFHVDLMIRLPDKRVRYLEVH